MGDDESAEGGLLKLGGGGARYGFLTHNGQVSSGELAKSRKCRGHRLASTQLRHIRMTKVREQ